MKKAFHPSHDYQITVQKYLVEFGPRFDSNGKLRNRPPSRCPACLEPMKIVGEDRLPHDRIFSHISINNPPPCPLRNRADHKYEFLEESPQDNEAGRRLRRSFFDNWEKHWGQMLLLLRFMNVQDFIDLIHLADKTRLWNRGKLSEWEIPYIFLVWKEWKPVEKRDGTILRATWIRFWFDSRVRTLEDIWIRTQGNPRIIKALYHNPKRAASPGLDHLIDTDVIGIDTKFLNAHHKNPATFVIDKIHRSFPNELSK